MTSDNYELETAVTIARIITSIKSEIEKLDELAQRSQPPLKLEVTREIVSKQRLAMLFYVEANMLYRMLDIKDAIAKLPDKREFDNVKSQVNAHESKIESTLGSIKELYEEYKEREKRGEALYE